MMRTAVHVLAALALVACSAGPRPRDVVVRGRGPVDAGGGAAEQAVAAPPPPAPVVTATPTTKLRVVARASCRALAIDETRVFFGSNDDDGVFSVRKEGGEPVRLARRAPVAGALTIDATRLAWIATPGDVVLSVPLGGGNAVTLRDRGIFSDVAMQGGDVFIAEILGGGGAITRVTGSTATRVGMFDGGPRAIAVDATHVYVATSQKVLRMPHDRGDLETLATGTGFDSPVVDDAAVFVLAATPSGGRDVLRIPKTGGEPKGLASDVRAAPIAEQGGEIFYFDARRPALLAVPVGGGEPRVVATDDALARPSAIAVDAASVYVATGEREDGAIVAMDRGKR